MTAEISPKTTAAQRRQNIRETAEALGINDAYISVLIDTFYDRVRAHPILGPIFDDAIGDQWDNHLPIIKTFWVSFIFGDGSYTRDMGAVHKNLTKVRPEHFAIWLELFRATLQETAPKPEAIEFFMIRAERVAQGLQTIMYGRRDVFGQKSKH
ncbi:MAG: globin [Alphaproteobacteria bacterium]|nr:globin [Alphaproteobacteria bacterium]